MWVCILFVFVLECVLVLGVLDPLDFRKGDTVIWFVSYEDHF
jgi:hypothetical protein